MARTYIVTGAASGIGAAVVDLLVEQGEKVIGVDLAGADVNVDLGTASGRQSGVAQVLELAAGQVDAVIASAGISAPIPATMAVNFFGVTEFVEGLLPALSQSQAPRVAVVSSMASLQTVVDELVDAALAGDEAAALEIATGLIDENDPQAGYPIYSSSKRALSRWVRRESVTPRFAGAGIALNAVAPGIVKTPMTEDLRATSEMIAYLDAQVPMPLNYHQPAESIAHLLIWLTSVENSHTAGQTIYCDGGADVMLRGDEIWKLAH